MTILVAPDKFKGSLTAIQASDAIKSGLLSVDPSLNIITLPMADGGDGTSELLAMLTGGKMVAARTIDPLFRAMDAIYGLSGDGKVAFIEMAKASGLLLLEPAERNPLYSTSYGTGLLIADALSRGVDQVVVCIGGSATNDAGTGMAEALGYEFYNSKAERLKPTGESLRDLSIIKTDHVNPLVKRTQFIALCDVDNPLYGENGAACVYAPQKGASPEEVKLLDQGLLNFDQVVLRTFHTSANFSGAGAGGGLPAGGKVLLGMTIIPGMKYISEATHLNEKVQVSDLIITGEGKIDRQTLSGKVVMEVASLGARCGKPVVAVCGVCELTDDEIHKMGISGVISLVNESLPPEKAMQQAARHLEQRIAEAFGSRFSRP